MINTFKELRHYELSKFHFKTDRVTEATRKDKLEEF